MKSVLTILECSFNYSNPSKVASRVQKYFIKLAKAGLPVPGRVPNIPRLGTRVREKTWFMFQFFRFNGLFIFFISCLLITMIDCVGKQMQVVAEKEWEHLRNHVVDMWRMSTDYTCLIPLVPWVITTRFIFQNLFIERSGYQQIRLLAPGFTRLVIWRVFSKNSYCTFTGFASWCVIDRPPRTQKMSCLKVSRLSYTMAQPWHVLFQIVWPIGLAE